MAKAQFKQHLPKSMRVLILMILLLSLFCALFNQLSYELFPESSLNQLLSLSLQGIKKHHYWQFLTYFFIVESPDGFSFSFILDLFFDLYLFFILGISIIKKVSTKAFLILFLLSGLILGGIGALLMFLTKSTTHIMGLGPALDSIIIVWLMIHPHFEIVRVAPFPIKTRNLIFIFLALSLLQKLSEGSFLLLTLTLCSLFVGYLFGTLVFGVRSPFAFTKKLDYFLTSIGKWSRRRFTRKAKSDSIIEINWRH